MSKLNNFILEIKNSLPDNGCHIDSLAKDTRFYYQNSEYGDPLKKCFDKLGIESKEFRPVSPYPNYKICSVSSSARLCFLFLLNEYGKDNVEFEAHLPNPTGSGNPAQPDAKAGNIYFECKCQEIVNGEKETLSIDYLELLGKHFGLFDLKINEYERTISAHLTDLSVKYDEDYDKTHFNVKQLFTHLLAIALKHPDEKDEVCLQYIFFRPKDMGDKTRKVYKELDAEIDAIWNSDMMSYFLDKHKNIKLLEPRKVSVDKECFGVDPKELLKSL